MTDHKKVKIQKVLKWTFKCSVLKFAHWFKDKGDILHLTNTESWRNQKYKNKTKKGINSEDKLQQQVCDHEKKLGDSEDRKIEIITCAEQNENRLKKAETEAWQQTQTDAEGVWSGLLQIAAVSYGLIWDEDKHRIDSLASSST